MATTSTSSRSEIRAYQTQLNESGANPKLVVDGLWGPKTEAAHKEYGDEGEKSTSGNPDLEGTGDGARFGIPDGAETWHNKDTGEVWLVYQVPGTEDDPVYMKWHIPNEEDLQSFFGPDQPVEYTHSLSADDAMWADAVSFGSTDEIPPGLTAPFSAWAETMTTESKIQPWILDDDYQRLFAMAVVEGRDLTEAELAQTKWYSDHNEVQREWMRRTNGDPSTAEQWINDNRSVYSQYMLDQGMGLSDPKLVNFLADKVTMGDWTEAEMQKQIQVLSDDYFSGEPVDPELQKFIDDESVTWSKTSDDETEVRGIVNRWLGTNFGNWDDTQVAHWAGRMRNEPDAMEHLIETLKDQKAALFPEYDREADYETIAAPWRTMMQNTWGEVPADSDQTLQRVIKMNDATEAGKFLTTEGLSRGNQQVINGVQTALNRSFGGI